VWTAHPLWCVWMICPRCGAEILHGAQYCHRCGSPVDRISEEMMLVVTTPSIPSYRIVKVLGVVTALVPRTRGILGRLIAGWQSIRGGEIPAFTSELEKARMMAMERLKSKAQELGANAIVGLDLETSDLGLGAGIVVISATGTAVIAEMEEAS